MEAERERQEFEIAEVHRVEVSSRLRLMTERLSFNARQALFSNLAEYCSLGAAAFQRYGLQHRTVEYHERMVKIYEFMSNEFGNRLPRDKVEVMARSYMKEFMWEESLKTYARILDPERSFKLFSPKIDEQRLKESFWGGFYLIAEKGVFIACACFRENPCPVFSSNVSESESVKPGAAKQWKSWLPPRLSGNLPA